MTLWSTARAALPLLAFVLASGGCSGDGKPDPDETGSPPSETSPPETGTPKVVEGCGDGVAEVGEACDGADLRGRTCDDLGFAAGSLGCAADCTFDLATCAATCGNDRCERDETPTSCPADCAATSVGAGARHTCATLADGSVRCWGAADGHHMGGAGDLRTPLRVPGIDDAAEVCAGQRHSCVLNRDGTVSCWGANGFGAAGQNPRNPFVFPPQPVAGVVDAISLDCGRDHTCVVEGDRVECWGRNDYGQSGATRTVRLVQPTAADLVPGGPYTYAVSAGGRHTCAGLGPGVTDGGQACWGHGGRGALGYGDVSWRDAVTPSPVDQSAVIAAGDDHTCALVFAGVFGEPLPLPRYQVRCWGANDSGQLGIPAGPDQTSPVDTALSSAVMLAAGRAHTCAYNGSDLAGTLDCWGANESGQLGDGGTTATHEPRRALDGVLLDLSAGSAHTCAVLASGEVRCWGDNTVGQLGSGSLERFVPTPVAPEGL